MKNEIGKEPAAASLSLGEQGGKKKSIKRPKMLGWLGVGLCGLACALPFLGVIAGVSFFTAIAVYLEMIAIGALALAGVFFAYAYFQKKKKESGPYSGASCEADGSCGCGPETAPRENEKTKNAESREKPGAMACDVSNFNPEERERIIKNSKELFLNVQQIEELADGYALGFEGNSAQMITKLADFIAFDRQCCPFLSHELTAEPNNGLIWLRLRGGEGAKANIRAELSNLLPEDKSIPNGLGKTQKEMS